MKAIVVWEIVLPGSAVGMKSIAILRGSGAVIRTLRMRRHFKDVA